MRPVRLLLSGLLGVAMLTLLTGADTAQSWTVSKLRGGVQHMVDGEWTALSRGDVVLNDEFVRTADNGVVELHRGQEIISLSSSTVVQIEDKLGQQYTTVKANVGEVTITADVRNVQHFEVDTPFLAAVVKGTVFTVATDKKGSSVAVARGRVGVEDLKSHRRVIVEKGQTATSDSTGSLSVAGVSQGTGGSATEDAGLETAVSSAVSSATDTASTTVSDAADTVTNLVGDGANGNASDTGLLNSVIHGSGQCNGNGNNC